MNRHDHLHVVQPGEIDLLGHAGNLRYLEWMQEAAVAHSSAVGWPPERYRSEGVAWIVRSHQIDYLKPVYAGETVCIRTWVEEMSKATSLRRFEMVRQGDGAILARASTDWALIDLRRGTPVRIPAPVVEAFEAESPHAV